jgi:DNA-binding response OmpR family regulator
MQILIIEDDQLTAKAIAYQLSHLDYEVTIASDGKHALEIVESKSFDLIICDLILPDISGVTVVQLVGNFHEKNIPTIFISKLENGKRILEQNKILYEAFLLKPLASDALIAEIRKFEVSK